MPHGDLDYAIELDKEAMSLKGTSGAAHKGKIGQPTKGK